MAWPARRAYHHYRPAQTIIYSSPLLYQVATATLATSKLRGPSVTCCAGAKKSPLSRLGCPPPSIDGRRAARYGSTAGATVPYDTLVLATGRPARLFWPREWGAVRPARAKDPGKKSATLDPARRILLSLKRAERATDPERPRCPPLFGFVIVRRRPTGVENWRRRSPELAMKNLPGEFPTSPTQNPGGLIEGGGPSHTAGFYTRTFRPYAHGAAAAPRPSKFQLGSAVSRMHFKRVSSSAVSRLAARYFCGRPAYARSIRAGWLRYAGPDAAGPREKSSLTFPRPRGNPDVFVIGDYSDHQCLARGKPVPGIAPASQTARHTVAGTIKNRLRGHPLSAGPFVTGTPAIWRPSAKRSAVIDFRLDPGTRFGFAWWIWGLAHIYFLIGACATGLPVALKLGFGFTSPAAAMPALHHAGGCAPKVPFRSTRWDPVRDPHYENAPECRFGLCPK